MNKTFTPTKIGFFTLLMGVSLLHQQVASATPAAAPISTTPTESPEATSQPLVYQAALSAVSTSAENQHNSPPVFTLSGESSSDVGQQVLLQIEAAAANAGDRVTLTLDSVVALGNNSAANFAGATFGPSLPHTANGTARTVMNWVPKKEHRGYIEFFFSAQDQHGNKSQESVLFLVDMPLVIKPVPTLQLTAGEPFETIIAIEEADWHQLYEASFMDEAPEWLQVETVSLSGNSAIRLWGTPDKTATGNYHLMLYAETIFGKWDTSLLQIEVTDGGTNCLAQQQLSLSASCSDNPATERKWLIQNPNNCEILVKWRVHNTSQEGSLMVSPGDTYFTTTRLNKGADMVLISWTDGQGKSRQKSANAATAKCNKQKGKPSGQRALASALSTKPLQAYPMPFDNTLYLSHENITTSSNIQLQLISLDGKQYHVTDGMQRSMEGKIELSLEQATIPAGVYVLKLWIDDAAPVYTRVVKSSE